MCICVETQVYVQPDGLRYIYCYVNIMNFHEMWKWYVYKYYTYLSDMQCSLFFFSSAQFFNMLFFIVALEYFHLHTLANRFSV